MSKKDKDCNCLKYCICTLVCSIILAVAMFIADFIIHGYCLAEFYEDTEYLWRGEGEIAEFMFFNILIYLLSAILIVVLFKKFVLNAGKKEFCKNSLSFGLLIGALLGVVVLGFYAYMPISFGLALSWFFANLLHGILIAVILYLLHKNQAK